MGDLTEPGGAAPGEFRRRQMVFMRMGEDDPGEFCEVDLVIGNLPEGVRPEIHHGIGIDKIAAPAAEILSAQLFRLLAYGAFAPEGGNALRCRCPEKRNFHGGFFSLRN